MHYHRRAHWLDGLIRKLAGAISQIEAEFSNSHGRRKSINRGNLASGAQPPFESGASEGFGAPASGFQTVGRCVDCEILFDPYIRFGRRYT